MDIPTIKADSMQRYLIPKWKKVLHAMYCSLIRQTIEAGGITPIHNPENSVNFIVVIHLKW